MPSVRALKRIISTGHDGTIRMILETYGGMLGTKLPALLCEDNLLNSLTLELKIEFTENILWILTNLTAVLNIGETN